MLNVVVLNAGRGAATLIPALLDRQVYKASTELRYGKSTGDIRSFWNWGLPHSRFPADAPEMILTRFSLLYLPIAIH